LCAARDLYQYDIILPRPDMHIGGAATACPTMCSNVSLRV
jgi:hypothetical protein